MGVVTCFLWADATLTPPRVQARMFLVSLVVVALPARYYGADYQHGVAHGVVVVVTNIINPCQLYPCSRDNRTFLGVDCAQWRKQ